VDRLPQGCRCPRSLVIPRWCRRRFRHDVARRLRSARSRLALPGGPIVDDRCRVTRKRRPREVLQVLSEVCMRPARRAFFQPNGAWSISLVKSRARCTWLCPQQPANVFNASGERSSVLPISIVGARPILRCLSDILKAHDPMEQSRRRRQRLPDLNLERAFDSPPPIASLSMAASRQRPPMPTTPLGL
jgi:hypothetical protein